MLNVDSTGDKFVELGWCLCRNPGMARARGRVEVW